MMGATGEPSGYYPTDSNGLAVGQTPSGLRGCVGCCGKWWLLNWY
jgi:hypothetical protein